MKNPGIIEDIMHHLVHNSILYTVGAVGFIHVTFLIVSLYAHVMPLAYFNILSVTIYLFCVLFCKIGVILPVYVSIILEVAIYTVVSVYYLGWNCGSYCFLFSMIPIIIYLGCFLFKGFRRWIVVFVLALYFAEYLFIYFRFADAKPVFEVGYALRAFLMIFSAFLMMFDIVFYNMIYINSSESEMTSLEKKNEKLSADAKEDVLTSLLNRRGFLPIVENLTKSGRSCHFCIAFCDIDNFKRINESYGHDCGDEVLRHISRMIKREMHGCEICRWGGEEIIILMRDYDLTVARQKMEYLRKCVETTPTVFYNKRISTTITIGLEEYNDDHREPEDIIKVADERMYYGKQHGKNILIYEDMG